MKELFRSVLKTIKCECGRYHKVVVETEDICKQEDPYLQPGWPCEVWEKESRKFLRYYKITNAGGKQFYENPENGLYNWHNYRPIGTEWDFIPADIEEVCIAFPGWVEMEKYSICMHTVLPEEYYETTIQRPEWA